VLLTGKVKEAVTRVRDGRRVYDAVVLDAPPTGRITRFLNVTADVAGLAKVGPIKTQSDGVMAVLRSSQTAVHLVTLLEEMPVQETRDAIAELTATGLPVGSIVVNLTRPPLLPPPVLALAQSGQVDHAALGRSLRAAGLDAGLAAPLAAEVTEHAVRVELESMYRAQIADLGRPVYELPALPPPMDLGGLYELAEALGGSGES
jgi:anion-transporting  ArsA/GET3 family ATPase